MGKGREADTQMQLVLGARMPGTAFISQNDFLALCVRVGEGKMPAM
jgi:hypothetical protein